MPRKEARAEVGLGAESTSAGMDEAVNPCGGGSGQFRRGSPPSRPAFELRSRSRTMCPTPTTNANRETRFRHCAGRRRAHSLCHTVRVTLADGAQRFILENLAPPPKAPPPAAEPAGQAEVALIAVEAMTLPPQPVSYKLG
jgi:hypothetical protein